MTSRQLVVSVHAALIGLLLVAAAITYGDGHAPLAADDPNVESAGILRLFSTALAGIGLLVGALVAGAVALWMRTGVPVFIVATDIVLVLVLLYLAAPAWVEAPLLGLLLLILSGGLAGAGMVGVARGTRSD